MRITNKILSKQKDDDGDQFRPADLIIPLLNSSNSLSHHPSIPPFVHSFVPFAFPSKLAHFIIIFTHPPNDFAGVRGGLTAGE